jgi:hypothetical protein
LDLKAGKETSKPSNAENTDYPGKSNNASISKGDRTYLVDVFFGEAWEKIMENLDGSAIARYLC